MGRGVSLTRMPSSAFPPSYVCTESASRACAYELDGWSRLRLVRRAMGAVSAGQNKSVSFPDHLGADK